MSTHAKCSVKPTARETNVLVEGGGSVYLFRPCSTKETRWIKHHSCLDEAQFFGGALAVAHRYISDLVSAAAADRLIVRRGA